MHNLVKKLFYPEVMADFNINPKQSVPKRKAFFPDEAYQLIKGKMYTLFYHFVWLSLA